jgi:Pentapeptide repeats (8 copies)
MTEPDRPRSTFAGLADLSARTPVRVLSPDEIDQMLAGHRLYLETEYHQGHRANFSSADLTGRDFSGLNLRGIKMDRAVLRGADFTGAHLQSANLIGAILQEACFDRADLSRARLSGANLVSSSLEDACLTKADMEFALMLREADKR